MTLTAVNHLKVTDIVTCAITMQGRQTVITDNIIMDELNWSSRAFLVAKLYHDLFVTAKFLGIINYYATCYLPHILLTNKLL